METSSALIIFVRGPVLGRVKTRLAATIGDEQALKVYNLLLKHTHSISLGLSCTKYVYYSDEIVPHDLWDEGNFVKRVQTGNDLGTRMLNAFQSTFADGHQQVIIIGSDCYQLISGRSRNKDFFHGANINSILLHHKTRSILR